MESNTSDLISTLRRSQTALGPQCSYRSVANDESLIPSKIFDISSKSKTNPLNVFISDVCDDFYTKYRTVSCLNMLSIY